MSLYLKILIETAHYASLIPFANEPTFFAMKAFGGFDMLLAFLCAVSGAILGAEFNFSIGYCLKKLYLKQQNPKYLKPNNYEKGKKFFAKYGIFLLVISWLPTLNSSVFAAGFFGMRAKIVLPIVLIGQIIHYGWFLFY